MKPNLSVEYCGVKFKNPMVIASASPSKNGEYMRRCAESGAGGVIAKTYSPEPLAQKYVSPRFTVLHNKGTGPTTTPTIHANFSPPTTPRNGCGRWRLRRRRVTNATARWSAVSREIQRRAGLSLAKRMEDLGLPMLELNFGCPHPKDLGYKSGQELGNSSRGGG